MSGTIPITEDVCAHGAFFDGNDDFGGPPYRFFIASLVISPIIYLACSTSWWLVGTYRRRAAERAAAIAAGGASGPQQSNYQTLIDNSPSSSSSSSPTYPSYSPAPDCYDLEAGSVSPSMSPSSSSSAIAPLSTSLLSPSEQASNDTHEPTVSRHTQFLLFLRSLTRSSPLFAFTAVISTIQFILTLGALFYGISMGEQCCMGGTGALYATLCLRLCLAYLNIRVGYWQTNSRTSTIPVADKSSSIGFLIHYIWLSFAFVLIETGDCSTNAPVMYGVSMMNVIFLLINYSVLALFTGVQYISSRTSFTSDVLVVLSRTMCKICMVGWCYGGALDLHDAVTDIEMEIACLPCVTYDELVQREEQRKRRKMKVAGKWVNPASPAISDDFTISIMIEDIRTDEQKLSDNVDDSMSTIDTATSSSSSSVSSSPMAMPSPSPSASVDEEPEVLSCAICLCAYEPTDIIRPLPCAHHLHKSCSDSWLKVKSTCPLCVRSVLIH